MGKKFVLIFTLVAVSFALLSCGSTSSVAADEDPESVDAVSDSEVLDASSESQETPDASGAEVADSLLLDTSSESQEASEAGAVSDSEALDTSSESQEVSEAGAVSDSEALDASSESAAPEPSSESQKIPEIVRKDLPENMRAGAKGDRKPVVETDPALISVINEGKEKFIQSFFTDGEKQITIEYNLYIPENIDYEKKYPLVMYIPDASAVGKMAKEIVEQYFGADVWVTEEEQKKHQCFVFVPAFSVLAVDDNYDTSEEVEVVVTILQNLVKNYNIDTERVYATGQSMGCMTSLYLASKYPDLFAASLFVSGQWWKYSLSPLKNANFFYIVADGDEKAGAGQSEVMDLIGSGNYAYGIWSAAEQEDVQSGNALKMISEGKNANFIRFEKGTVLAGGAADSKHEHNSSFTYGYRIPAVRDWLFGQKNSNPQPDILSGN